MNLSAKPSFFIRQIYPWGVLAWPAGCFVVPVKVDFFCSDLFAKQLSLQDIVRGENPLFRSLSTEEKCSFSMGHVVVLLTSPFLSLLAFIYLLEENN